MTEGDNSHTITYAYDSQNQLIRENNEDENYTHTWTYNAGGNITQRNRYSYTSGEQLGEESTPAVVYTYGEPGTPETPSDYNEQWDDLLRQYGTRTVTYDEIGNPEIFGDRAFTWEHGRQLKSLTEGTTTWNYTYDADGMRTGRSNGTVSYQYVYNGSQLTQMKKGNDTLTFTYDASGIPLTVTHGSNKYYYATNLQGDVVAILNVAGSAVAGYTYDAWGNCTVTGVSSIAELNPLRYRGYVYDQETGLYYVSSRYYDPEIGRWISPEPNVYNGEFDEGAGLIGYNVYAYCANNPVNYYDPTGEFVISTLLICVAAGAIIGGTIGGIAGNAYANSKGYTGWDKTKSILTGIGIGGLAGGALGYFAAPAVVSATGVAGISITSGGISTIAALGTSFGKLGTLIANNGQQIIDWGKTTRHGMQRMIERGVTQNMVEVWAKTGKALQQAGDKILYITKQGAVVIDKAGKVITAYTSQYFDPAMQEVVEKLFGK